jgi:hypothetical protein
MTFKFASPVGLRSSTLELTTKGWTHSTQLREEQAADVAEIGPDTSASDMLP